MNSKHYYKKDYNHYFILRYIYIPASILYSSNAKMHQFEAYIKEYINSNNEIKKSYTLSQSNKILEKYLWSIEYITNFNETNVETLSNIKWEELAEQYTMRELEIKRRVKSLIYWKIKKVEAVELAKNQISENTNSLSNERLSSEEAASILNQFSEVMQSIFKKTAQDIEIMLEDNFEIEESSLSTIDKQKDEKIALGRPKLTPEEKKLRTCDNQN